MIQPQNRRTNKTFERQHLAYKLFIRTIYLFNVFFESANIIGPIPNIVPTLFIYSLAGN